MNPRAPVVTLALALGLAGHSLAAPAVLLVNPTQSSITATLCLTVCGTLCSSDTSPVSGSMTVGLDCLTQPANLIVHDFHFLLNNTINLNLNFGLVCGRFDASGSAVAMHYGTPGTPTPPSPLSGGAFSILDVPSTTSGTLAYTSTNLVCVGLQAAGRPCADTINLATLGAGSVDLNGSMAVVGRTVTATLNINSSGPIDPNNPGLGTLSIVGTVVASGEVPIPDEATFVAALLGLNTDLDAVCESDINEDGLLDGRDVQAYLDLLLAR